MRAKSVLGVTRIIVMKREVFDTSSEFLQTRPHKTLSRFHLKITTFSKNGTM